MKRSSPVTPKTRALPTEDDAPLVRAKPRRAAATPTGKTLTLQDARRLMDAKLAESALQEHAKKLRYQPMTAEQFASLMPRPPRDTRHVAGFLLPYFDLRGRPTSFWRYRMLEPPKIGFAAHTSARAPKYAQAPGTLNELYIPPLLDWPSIAADPRVPIIITEGELKAACACSMDFATLGLGGVWNWTSARAGEPVLPGFADFTWKERAVVICYDSDAVTNSQVMQAENALARALCRLGAVPHIARIPHEGDRKTGLDDYLVQQGRARYIAEVLEPALASPWKPAAMLHELNEHVVYVEDPGVMLRLSNLQRMTPSAFAEHAFATWRFQEHVETAQGSKKIERSAPAAWLQWPGRATCARTTFAPGRPRITGGELNLWRGWGVEPAEGDVGPWRALLDFLFAGADPAHRLWFERWLAYPLQHPGTKQFTAAVMWGRIHGTGKSLVGYSMFRIYGHHATEIADDHLVGAHNEWAENMQFVMGDEITGGDKRRSADRMKALITQRQMRINIKYIPSYVVPDCINYYFTSNHPDAFFLEDTDRRFFIHEVPGRPLPESFYRDYVAWLDGGGAAALFAYLLTLDMGDYSPAGHAPMTASKRDMIGVGRSELGDWVARLRDDPDGVLRSGGRVLPYALWTSEDLRAVFDPEGRGKVTPNGLARELRRAGFLQAYNGHGVPTPLGQLRLWMVRDVARLQGAQHSSALSDEYCAERGLDPKTGEVRGKNGKKY